MKTHITTLTFILTLIAGGVYSQCKEFQWPDDEELNQETKRKYTLQTDYVKNEQWKEAIASNMWLMENTPQLQEGIYINAEKIYRNLADAAEDDAQKKVYSDSLMIVLDLRMENCGDRKGLMDKKAIFGFMYNYKNKDTVDWILDVFEETLELNGSDALANNLEYYFVAVQLNKVYKKNLTDDQIIEKFNYIQGLIDERIAKETDEKEIKEFKKAKEKNTEILAKIVNFDCDKVREILGPKLKENPSDVQTAEMIFLFMRLGECTDDPLWLDAVKVMHENNPSFITSKVIGAKCLAADDIECAEQYFSQGVELAVEDADKAEMLNNLGNIDRRAKNYTAARAHYREAIALNADEARKDAYKYIAVMYMNSWEICKKGQSQAEDRAIYIAAYNMYKRAGDAEGMAAAKAQFPTVSNLFEQNLSKGDNMSTGCWISETVQLDTRD